MACARALAQIQIALAQNNDVALANELEHTQEMIKTMRAAHGG